MLGGEAQREFPQGREVAGPKKMSLRRPGGFRQIDLPRGQPGAQFFGRQVHQFKVRAVQGRIRQRLTDRDASNLTHGLGAALHMLDV